MTTKEDVASSTTIYKCPNPKKGHPIEKMRLNNSALKPSHSPNAHRTKWIKPQTGQTQLPFKLWRRRDDLTIAYIHEFSGDQTGHRRILFNITN